MSPRRQRKHSWRFCGWDLAAYADPQQDNPDDGLFGDGAKLPRIKRPFGVIPEDIEMTCWHHAHFRSIADWNSVAFSARNPLYQ